MEFQEIIEKRQSIRKFKDARIPKEHIAEIVNAAGLAPSGKNIQNWHFVVVQNEELKQKIGQTILDKNEVVSLELDKIDKSKGDAFRNFVKNFTVFFLKAPVVTIVFTTEYLPSGYYEHKAINSAQALLDDLVKLKNPGMQSLGAALENFALKAVDLGYGTCWVTSANYAANEITALLKDETGFEKEDYFMAALMVLGVPDGDHKSPKRKPLEQILTYID